MARRRASEDVRRQQIRAAALEVAAREGLGGLTVRSVAAEANVSHALVLFHFGRKERLLQELLEWLLSSTFILHVSPEIARVPRALDRLAALLEQEIVRLSREPARTRLFFEFWALGDLDEPIRARISAGLARYRAAFRDTLEEGQLAEPGASTGADTQALAAVAVSCIQGCIVQAMTDPDEFDTDAYLTTVRLGVARLAGENGDRE